MGEVCLKTSNIKWSDSNGESYDYIDLSSVSRDNYSIMETVKVDENTAPSRAKKIIKTEDIIFATTRPTLKRLTIIPESFDNQICSTGFVVLRPNQQKVASEFIFYSLLQDSFMDRMESLQRGASYPAVTDSDVKGFEIPLPPLPEQQRIVSILDQCFAAIAKAKANAEQNLKNAKELFDCVLNNILYDKKWAVRQLGEACNRVEYGTSSKAKPKGNLPVMRMGNIQNGKFDWESLVYSDNEEDNKKYLLKYNDVLFNRTNSPELVGKTAIYKGERPAIFAGYLIRLHRKEDLLDADYLNYYLNSKMAFDYGKTVVISSVNQANSNGPKLKTYPIPLPTLEEQQSIVQQLDALRTETQKLEAVYQKKIADLEELKKSILQKAFAGELETETSTSSVPLEYEINDNFSKAAEPTSNQL